MDETLSSEKLNELLNGMWRNACISDTYEPGSAFKIVTAAAALEEKLVKLDDKFFAPDIRRWKTEPSAVTKPADIEARLLLTV